MNPLLFSCLIGAFICQITAASGPLDSTSRLPSHGMSKAKPKSRSLEYRRYRFAAFSKFHDGCTYRGKFYEEDASWPVACDAICTCRREGDIFYMSCEEMCPDTALPPGCYLAYLPTRSMSLSRDCCPIVTCPQVPPPLPED